MCHFVTATMSAGGDVDAVRKIAKGFALRWEEFRNPSVAKILNRGEKCFFTTRGICDCGTDLGSAHRPPFVGSPPDIQGEAQKLRKKRWGAAKIERHLKQRQADFERNVAEAKESKDRLLPHNAEIWCNFICAVLNSGAARAIGILLHFYAGRIETEQIPLGDRRTICVRDLTVEHLLELEEDVLYEFTQART